MPYGRHCHKTVFTEYLATTTAFSSARLNLELPPHLDLNFTKVRETVSSFGVAFLYIHPSSSPLLHFFRFRLAYNVIVS